MDNNGILGWRVSFGSCKYMIFFFCIISVSELYFIVFFYKNKYLEAADITSLLCGSGLEV